MIVGNDRVAVWLQFADVVRLIRRELGKSMKEYDVSLTEFRILSALDKKGPMTMARIADELLITRAGTTLLTDSLEKKRLVNRVRLEGDRRLVHIRLTRKGRAVAAAALKGQMLLLEEMLRALNDGDMAALKGITAKLRSSLDNMQH